VSIPVALLPKVRSPAIMSAMQHMPCSLRIGTFLGLPCARQETNVGCHLPVIGKGMGTKVSDLFVVCGCRICHDLMDARDKRGIHLREAYPAAYVDRLLQALVETQSRLVAMGIIVVTEGEIV
jgi:hypothetical protein